MTTIYLETHGCSRRKLDVAKFHRYFAANGYTIVTDPSQADEILVTTCAFKYDEEEESLRAIEELSRHRGRIVVYGCLPSIAPEKYGSRYGFASISPRDIDTIDDHYPDVSRRFRDLDDENLIRGETNHAPLPKALKKFTRDFELSVPFFLKSCRYVKNKFLAPDRNYYLFTSRGCLGSCSYCGVRFAVGPLVSKPMETVAREFRRGIQGGYRSFTIIGDDVGGYGHDCGTDFATLVSMLQEQVEAIPDRSEREKVAINIDEINPRWIISQGDRLARHLSSGSVKSMLCPIQSGSARVLGLMNRNDDIDELMKCLTAIKTANSQLQLHSQIIVGFPTETEEEFDESLQKITGAAFSSVTLFPYDDKENTPSYQMHPKVPEQVKQERIRKAQSFLRRHGVRSALCCSE